MLELNQVSKDFNGLRALDRLTFKVNEAEIVGLIGPNGSGKSTAFNVIMGTLPVTSGEIHFNGKNITPLPAHQVARLGLSRTFQLVRPFLRLTVMENVEAGILFGPTKIKLKGDVKAEAMQILERVGLAEKAAHKAADLSVVERKWLEIARALAGKPKMLLLDEFMAGLSTSQIPRALELIRSLKASGISVIIVEHIVKAITGACERVIVLNGGKKLAEGSVKEIVNDPDVIDAYLGTRHAKSH
ncbi:MAG: ABC transporter ATP-binding protein [Anaerolineales bacterium]